MSAKIRLLIIDALFPVIHGQWRTTEINYFLNHPQFSTDILISPCFDITQTLNQTLTESFMHYKRLYNYLDDYNICIFNPKFNCLNQFNKSIDGKFYNSKYPGDFLFTSSPVVDFSTYQVVYVIFLGTYQSNLGWINSGNWSVVCKIYPGGGYVSDLQAINKSIANIRSQNHLVITTQQFITNNLLQHVPRIETILGVPLLEPTFQSPVKHFQAHKLDICMSCLGYYPKKGIDDYLKIIEHFEQQYPDLAIRFHLVGCTKQLLTSRGLITSSELTNLTFHGVMCPQALNTLYIQTIDVIVSLSKICPGADADGFPIGGEAMARGCIPILTDPYQSNVYFNYTEQHGLVIPSFDLERIDSFILKLYHSVELRNELSNNTQVKSYDIFCSQRQLDPIAEFLAIEANKS